MATWQGNNGGLLAGIGGVNSNAPGVNDANATLGLIQQNNELQRSGANNVGLQALQGLTGVAQAYQQSQQAERQQAFQQAYANAYASGDRSALRQLATQFPDQIDAVRKGMGFIDEDQQKTIGNLAAGARVAAISNESMDTWLKNNANELQRAGINSQDVSQMYQQNPQQFGEFVDHLGMAALGPVDYFNTQDKMSGRNIQQQNADTSSYTAQQGMRQGDERLAIDRFKAQTGADLNAQQLRLDSMYKKATTDNARANIQQKSGQIRQAMQEKTSGVANNIAAVSSNISQMSNLGQLVNSDPGIVSGTFGFGSQGAFGRALPTVTPSSRDFESQRDQVLGSLLTDGSLKATFGSNPTEGERAALEKSISTLKSATTPQQFNNELGRLQQRSVDMAKRQISALGIKKVPLPADKEAAAVNYLSSNPDQIGAFIQDYGYLPEGYWRKQGGQ